MNELDKIKDGLPTEVGDILVKGIETGAKVGKKGGEKISDLIDWIVDLIFKK